jgi:hypothetical protein
MRSILLPLLLSGCAITPYWTPEPRLVAPVLRVVDVPVLTCNDGHAWSCWEYERGEIQVLIGVPASARDCLISHERKHAEGWTHNIERRHFAIDCGDGTMWLWPIR